MGAFLPQREHRALGVLGQGHATGVHHVERLGDERAAEGGHPARHVVDVVHGDVGEPHGWRAVLLALRPLLFPLLGEAGDGGVALGEHGVGALLAGRFVDARPTEELFVEALPALLVGQGDVGPREQTVRIGSHDASPPAGSNRTYQGPGPSVEDATRSLLPEAPLAGRQP